MTVIVIDHNPRWSDTGMKNKEKLWMHRLKSFHPNGMNKINDFTRMNMGYMTLFDSLPPIPRIKFIAIQFLKLNVYTVRLQSN
jgi:hypothetical protein